MTEEKIDEFFREGYVVLPELVPAAAAEAVLAARPAGLGAGERWQAHIFDHDQPEKDAAIHRLLVEPAVIGAVEQIFAGPARVWYGMLAVVPAGGGHGLPWHQDNQYTLLLGPALNVFIALTDVTPERAGLWIAPRSHRLSRQPAVRNETTAPGHREAAVAPENGVPLPPMRPGDACIFDRNTYHRSVRNDTDRDRYAYAAQYLAENTRLAETGKKDPKRMLVGHLAERWAG